MAMMRWTFCSSYVSRRRREMKRMAVGNDNNESTAVCGVAYAAQSYIHKQWEKAITRSKVPWASRCGGSRRRNKLTGKDWSKQALVTSSSNCRRGWSLPGWLGR